MNVWKDLSKENFFLAMKENGHDYNGVDGGHAKHVLDKKVWMELKDNKA